MTKTQPGIEDMPDRIWIDPPKNGTKIYDHTWYFMVWSEESIEYTRRLTDAEIQELKRTAFDEGINGSETAMAIVSDTIDHLRERGVV